VEYCPGAQLITMVERKPTTQNTSVWEKAANFLSNPKVLDGAKTFLKGVLPGGGIVSTIAEV